KPEVQMVAVCDVDKTHCDRARKIVDERYGNGDCKSYPDFRELIGRGDLDAVQLAVPDHWHAIPAIAAARAGLDIHGQKPLARSIREGRAICDAVQRYGRVWQTGSQQRSEWKFRRACELVRNGRIGKIQKIEVGLPTGGGTDVKPVMPVPDGLDWNFWLGPAPKVPYRGVAHWDWRWIMDYSGGQLTDWAGHHIDIAHWGMGWDLTGPVEIEGRGNYPNEGLYNVATEYKFACKYADGIVMTVANNKQITQGAKWYGEKGWIHVNRAGLSASDEKILKEEIGPNEIRLYESRDHKQNFLDCVRSRRLTICPAEVGLRSISVGLLGEIAMLTGRKIKWNPQTEQILDDPQASALLGRSYREPWVL
ncbi:MAG TPA: Gfo/Idh/MocA family oxidoreductase, partial [Sedimentisphaerales bacterium]|nr:Gfo/Idh/MocA family oxidoreductase [Sedimentisphaerales bacterium]